MNIYSIYKATNKITGKIYIGFDSNWPKRKKRHLSDSFNNTSRGYNDVFHKAIRKYGKDSFEWEIIYQSLDGEYCKNIMEKHFISEYNSFINEKNSNGYNMTLGGDGMLGFKHSQESKNKNSISCGKNFRVWHKNGHIVSGKHIKNFCSENNLEYNSFKRMLHGTLFSYKDFYPYDNEIDISEVLEKYKEKIKVSMDTMGEKHAKKWKIKCPDGKIIEIFNLSKFCNSMGLNHRTFRNLKSLKGFSLL